MFLSDILSSLYALQAACGNNVLLVCTGDGALGQRVADVLAQCGTPFERVDGLFAFHETVDGSTVTAALRASLSVQQQKEVRVASGGIGEVLRSPTLNSRDRRLETAWFDPAFSTGQFTTFFQPVMDVRRESPIGYECLIRCHGAKLYHGGDIIDAVHARGMAREFDCYARRLALRSASGLLSKGERLFVNLLPSSIGVPSESLRQTLETLAASSMRACDVVFEVVESERLDDLPQLRRTCEFLREQGFGLALDDVGAGSATLQLISEIRPDFIKIDKALVWSLGNEITALGVRKLAELGHHFGIESIAEGIETEDTLEAVEELGISLVQGYLTGRPSAEMKHSWKRSLHAAIPVLG
ncbi:MAG: EAL domain-containing protein [Bryobacterales bacterium]|nr:EAL domain-containing protein [Bryobacterales bacterium]